MLMRSMDGWWAQCFRNAEQREWILKLIKRVRDEEDGFIFSRKMYEKALEERKKIGSFPDLEA